MTFANHMEASGKPGSGSFFCIKTNKSQTSPWSCTIFRAVHITQKTKDRLMGEYRIVAAKCDFLCQKSEIAKLNYFCSSTDPILLAHGEATYFILPDKSARAAVQRVPSIYRNKWLRNKYLYVKVGFVNLKFRSLGEEKLICEFLIHLLIAMPWAQREFNAQSLWRQIIQIIM